jgi:hypothetical protein
MTPQEMLEEMIDKAWTDYVDIHKAEIDSGYDDAMDGFDRKEAEGFACGLEAAYSVIYNKEYESKIPEFDPYEYEDNNG